MSHSSKQAAKLGAEMVAEVLHQGGIPEVMIGVRIVNSETHQLDYFIVSPLEKEKIRYVLSRVLGLIDGSISKSN